MNAPQALRTLARDSGQGWVDRPGSVRLFYRADDLTDPWTEPETVVLLHGVAENSVAWFAWIPQLARRYLVLRPDLRGFGRSTPMRADYPWSLDALADDLDAVLQALGLARARPHLVAAKAAGMVALHFAARHPGRLASLSLLGSPVRGRDVTALPGYGAEVVEQHGVAHWAANGQAARLGPGMPPAAHAWWTRMMGETPASTQAGFLRCLHGFDATLELENIDCPTLVVTSGGSKEATSPITAVSSIREWQSRIPDARLLVVPSPSYHLAASEPEKTAEAVLAFIAGASAVDQAPL